MHVHQLSYQRQCQKFGGNVFTGQEKNEFDFLKNTATTGRNRGKKSFSPSGKHTERAERGHQKTDVFQQYKKEGGNGNQRQGSCFMR